MTLQTKNYVLGKGKLYFDRFLPNTTTKTGERYFGNTTEFSITVASSTLDHYDSDQGVRQKDASVQTELNRTGVLTTDNMSDENIALFILGDISEVTQAADPVAGESLNAGNALVADMYYQLGATNANPSGVRGVSAVTITADPGGAATAAVAGTDYILDTDLARFQVVAGGALDGVDAEAAYTPNANTRQQIKTSAEAINGSLRFVATNPEGELKDVYIPSAQLTANGDWGLKGEEWQQCSFNLSVNQLPGMAAIYVDGRPA